MKEIKSENVQILNYSEEILKELAVQKENIFDELGMTMESFAKSYETAVDTGRLRNSITYDHDDDAVYVGTNVEYAPYIEFGVRCRDGLHYLEKAVKNHKAEYITIIKKYLD